MELQDQILRMYHVERLPVREIARAVGKSTRTVYEAVHANGGKVRGNARVDMRQAARMYDDGLPVKEIGARLGCSGAHASYLARISGCRMRGGGNRNHYAAELRLASDF